MWTPASGRSVPYLQSVGLVILAFHGDHCCADEEPAMRTDKEVRELQQKHDSMIEAGMHKDIIESKMKRTGVKGSSSFSKLANFDLPRDLLFDLMHILANNEFRISSTILGDDWNAKCRNFARAFQVNRGWLVPVPRRDDNDRRTPAERLAGTYIHVAPIEVQN